MGLAQNQVGIHALDFSARSLGICLIVRGKNDFTSKQMTALRKLVLDLTEQYRSPVQNVLRHYDVPKSGGYTCPSMDIKAFRAALTM